MADGNIDFNMIMTRLTSIEERFTESVNRSTQTHKDMYERLNKLEKVTVALDIKYTTIIDKLDKLCAKLDLIESKPAKRWESLVTQLIGIVAAAILGFLLARLGLG